MGRGGVALGNKDGDEGAEEGAVKVTYGSWFMVQGSWLMVASLKIKRKSTRKLINI